MSDSSSKPDLSALDFKSATLYAIRVVLHSADLNALTNALDQRMKDAGAFFENEAIVIDATALTENINWKALLKALRAHKLSPIGVMANDKNLESALREGLTAVDLSNAPSKNVAPANTSPNSSSNATQTIDSMAGKTDAVPASTPKENIEPASTTMVIDRPLRSGQRIYAKGGDLIVVGMVSQGAEVIADGNIHVYGPLRGKAMAGARGDTNARIFATQLDPELLAVAGVYRVIEAELEASVRNKPAIVQLQSDKLDILPLDSKG
ncbi:septum site-determining protein MinC [Pusillimonas sp. DMV24BSW_D]|uniref:septum site-determining protein MinC n=1 Tax=Neopusillimonas aestuarii TaxID=2716226 RepID=UPI00140C6608|nr:septum site-determining protein MinC [Pusillimonas sp. DMV24BSW_D]QIM48922.1 septum site-determining protein MinC [Pusillimonas sp. DMV24BSW_D]